MTTELNETNNVDNIIALLDKMTIQDISELIEAIEIKFTVAAAVAAHVDAGEAVVEEQTEFKATLTYVASNVKISVIKAVRQITSLGLKEAKVLVEEAMKAPKVIKDAIPKKEAEDIKTILETAGAKVDVK